MTMIYSYMSITCQVHSQLGNVWNKFASYYSEFILRLPFYNSCSLSLSFSTHYCTLYILAQRYFSSMSHYQVLESIQNDGLLSISPFLLLTPWEALRYLTVVLVAISSQWHHLETHRVIFTTVVHFAVAEFAKARATLVKVRERTWSGLL